MSTYCPTGIINEKKDSPSIKGSGLNSSKTRKYDIWAASDTEAYTLLTSTVSPFETIGGIYLQGTPEFEVQCTGVVNNGARHYNGTVTYKHAGRDEQSAADQELFEPGNEKVSSSFTGTSSKATTALSQTKYGTNSRDVGKAVNVQYDGEVEGVDINVPQGSFTVSTIIDGSQVDNDWFKARFKQIWTTNQNDFRSWPPGCVALSGMESRQRADGHWEIDYKFEIQPDESITTLDGITVNADKEGWEYVWIMYRPKDDSSQIVPEAVGAYIATLYEKSDFSQLGITQ